MFEERTLGPRLRLAPFGPAPRATVGAPRADGEGTASGWVWVLAEDPRGAIWIGTDRGLIDWNEGRLVRYLKPDGLPPDFVTALVHGGGALWVGTDAGVSVRRGGRFEATPLKEGVRDLALDRAGRLWATGANKILRVDRDGQVRAFPAPDPGALAVDTDDNVWVATGDGLRVGMRTGECLTDLHPNMALDPERRWDLLSAPVPSQVIVLPKKPAPAR